MNVFRFQLAINHEDPEVVISGLNEFRHQILVDHEAIESFGYCGRSVANGEHTFSAQEPFQVVGLLSSFISASPQLEELFVLWSLPGRDVDRKLSASHMLCFAAILHCASCRKTLCDEIVCRILHDFGKSIQMQLSSGNVELVHATLGLLISMCRTSKQNSRDVYQKVNFSDSTFGTLIQKGKNVSFNGKISTDARVLITILLFTILDSADPITIAGLLLSNSVVRKVTHSINKDAAHTVELTLNGIVHLLQHSPLIRLHIGDLVDSVCIQKLLQLYKGEDEVLQEVAHSFVLRFCRLASDLILQGDQQGGKKLSGGRDDSVTIAASASSCVSQLIKQLVPHQDERHKEVILPCADSPTCLIFLLDRSSSCW